MARFTRVRSAQCSRLNSIAVPRAKKVSRTIQICRVRVRSVARVWKRVQSRSTFRSFCCTRVRSCAIVRSRQLPSRAHLRFGAHLRNDRCCFAWRCAPRACTRACWARMTAAPRGFAKHQDPPQVGRVRAISASRLNNRFVLGLPSIPRSEVRLEPATTDHRGIAPGACA